MPSVNIIEDYTASITAIVDGTPQTVLLGNNTVLAARYATESQTSAAVALAAAGPNYADTATGLGATSEDDTFAVDEGDGTIGIYLHESGPTVTLLRTIIKTPSASTAAALIGFTRSETGAATDLTVEGKLRERVSVLDFDADPTGSNDSTTAFANAYEAGKGRTIFMPDGEYLIDADSMKIDAAGTQWVGESTWGTVIKPNSGETGVLCRNTSSASGSTLGAVVQNLLFDLNGENVTCVDLASVNNGVVQNCAFRQVSITDTGTLSSGSAVVTGLADTSAYEAGMYVVGDGIPAEATVLSVDSTTQITLSANATATGAESLSFVQGIGVKFDAPLSSGAYNNSVMNCHFLRLHKGVDWGTGANLNAVWGCEAISCAVGFSPYSSGVVDAPSIFGGRVEGCGVGVKEGATAGGYFNLRCEASKVTDFLFHATSIYPGIIFGYTASSASVLTDLNLATSPNINSSELGYRQYESSTTRVKYFSGRHVFAAAGQTPAAHAQTGHSIYLQDYGLVKNQTNWEFGNAAGDNRIIGIGADSSDNLVISGFRRKDSSNADVVLGRGVVRPNSNAAQAFGSASVQWLRAYFSDGVYVGGTKVLGTQQAAIADDASGEGNQATVNEIIAALRAHGIIDT